MSAGAVRILQTGNSENRDRKHVNILNMFALHAGNESSLAQQT